MNNFIEVALDSVLRGWYVFPCWPKSKNPMTEHGFKDASNDEAQIRVWWEANPEANVAIATGASRLFVIDIDHGIQGLKDLQRWMDARGLPMTYAVRTGRRPEFGAQLYYSGEGFKSTGWKDGEVSGDIRCSTGYVMALGSIHPSGEAYAALWDTEEILSVPECAWTLTTKVQDYDPATAVPDELADEWKDWLLEYAAFHNLDLRGYEKRMANGWWLGVICPWVGQHSTGPGGESSTVLGILDGRIAFECSHGTCKAAKRGTAAFKQQMRESLEKDGKAWLEAEPGAGPTITIGTGLPMPNAEAEPELTEENWRTFFDSKDVLLNCPPPTRFIDDFLMHQSICAIAAPVAQRKSLIALNVVHALCTGKPLFGFMQVKSRPSKVLYLCPEMGRISVAERIKKAGLADMLGVSLFVRTMNSGAVDITDVLKLPDAALLGSVVILDTAIRFMQGDETNAKDMKMFSSQLFDLQRKQGEHGSSIILYHSPKATKEAFELTLENCLRGSGELGAAVTDGHGTRLQPVEDGQDGWSAKSFIRHIKDRDYPGVRDFEVTCDRATGLMTRCSEEGATVTLSTKKPGTKANADGKDDAARIIIQSHLKKSPYATVGELMKELEEAGITRKKTWVTEARLKLRTDGGGSR